jgi:hypothetical protein
VNENLSQMVQQLKSTHGDDRVHVIETMGETFIVRMPTRPEYKRFRSYVIDAGKRNDAHDALISEVLLYPERAAATAIFDRKPALVETLGEWIAEQAGAGANVEKKAL